MEHIGKHLHLTSAFSQGCCIQVVQSLKFVSMSVDCLQMVCAF